MNSIGRALAIERARDARDPPSGCASRRAGLGLERSWYTSVMLDGVFRIALFLAYRTMRVWWYLRRPEEAGAFVAVWHDDELLLIRNSYRAGETIPCGHIGRRESPRAAARRELAEEVGIEVEESALAPATRFEIEHDYKHETAHVFELRTALRPRPCIDRREVVWAGFVPSAELEQRELVAHVRHYLAWRAARGGGDETPVGDD